MNQFSDFDLEWYPDALFIRDADAVERNYAINHAINHVSFDMMPDDLIATQDDVIVISTDESVQSEETANLFDELFSCSPTPIAT